MSSDRLGQVILNEIPVMSEILSALPNVGHDKRKGFNVARFELRPSGGKELTIIDVHRGLIPREAGTDEVHGNTGRS